MKKITLLSLIITSCVAAFADYENYDGQDVSGQDFSRRSLKNSSWVEASASSALFRSVNLTYANFTKAYATSANFEYANLAEANFTNANLTSAYFVMATLVNANFTNATINNASFRGAAVRGFTTEQLYSTKSYQDKNLSGVIFAANGLSEWNLDGQNLTSASFDYATLTNADFT
ncbi:MAG: pentapeptide repeat-containing protein, partial [Opitutales bacterium]|nr:pentapeptide repeat-containing protein [Opitutales bacterium]